MPDLTRLHIPLLPPISGAQHLNYYVDLEMKFYSQPKSPPWHPTNDINLGTEKVLNRNVGSCFYTKPRSGFHLSEAQSPHVKSLK